MSWNGAKTIMQIEVMGLPGTQVEFYHRGLQAPMDGDKAKVDAYISLPCAPASDDLADDYRFGEAVQVLGKPLTKEWGTVIAKGRRTMIINAMADTFAEAFEGVEKDVEAAFAPLVKAYRERKEKLRAAEWSPSDTA
jgi:hypothetical protein